MTPNKPKEKWEVVLRDAWKNGGDIEEIIDGINNALKGICSEVLKISEAQLALARKEERDRIAGEIKKMENQNITQKEVLNLLKTNPS